MESRGRPSRGRGRAQLVAKLVAVYPSADATPIRDEQQPVQGLQAVATPERVEPSSSIGPQQARVSREVSAPSPNTRMLQQLRLGPVAQAPIEEPDKLKTYRGTSGEANKVHCNYIRMKIEPNRGVFEYEVKFAPDIDSKGLRIDLLNQHLVELGGVKTFDGVTLFLPIQIPSKEFVSTNKLDNSEVILSVKFKGKKRLGECIQLYNVLFKRVMGCLDLVRFKRQHFDPSAPKILPQHQMEVWPGYVTAVDEYEDGVMLCLDVSHRVLRKKTALDHLRELARGDGANTADNARKSLIGSCVITRYNNRSYIIDELAFDMSPLSTFENSNGETITFLKYYKQQYGIDIIDLKQPLLISNSRVRLAGQEEAVANKLCLIPELAHLTGLTDENRKDFRLMKDLATYTRITPNQRIHSLRKFIQNVSSNQKCIQLLSSWGLSLDRDCIELACRTLAPEDIELGRGVTIPGSISADWSRASINNHVLEAVDISHWLILHTNKDYKYTKDFTECIMRIATPMGLSIRPPIVISLEDDRTATYVDALKKFMRSHPDLKLVVFIFPTIRDDRYSAVKKLCCVDYGVASQVINSKTISRQDKLRSVVQKIALQINCKLGGSLWAVKIPLKDCMICGLDTYHDPRRRGRSVFGLVASLNQNCTKYFNQVGFQEPHEEIAQSLQAVFRIALKRFFEVNGFMPKRIIFYRDGISDGQMQYCQQVEIGMMEECFNNSLFETKPLLTFVVVQKRINMRVMALASREYENPSPGTIVDHSITRRNMYDFFLVPQSVRQGTVSPTHYVVLKDTAQMKPDHVQRLSYKMCHMYYNWAGTVRVPACCQYAHKLAYMIGEHVKERPHPNLSNRLFFL